MNNPFKRRSNNDPTNPREEDLSAAELQEMNLTALDGWLTQTGQAVTVPGNFQIHLQERLRTKGEKRQPTIPQLRRRRRARIGWVAAGLALAAVLVVLVLPALRQNGDADQPPNAVSNGQTELPEVATATEPAPLERLLLSFLSESAQAQAGENSIFGQAELTLNAAFPEGLVEAPVYEQSIVNVTNAEQAKALAADLGIEGEVYTTSSEGGGSLYYVTDGIQEVWFINTTTHFTFLADFGSGIASSSSPQPLSSRALAAETFLKERGLLDFEYQVDERLSQDNRVIFTRLLNGQPLLENSAYNPYIEVVLDGECKVVSVFYRLNQMDPLGNYPLRSAQEAWNVVLGNPNDKRVQYSITSPQMAVRTVEPAWQRIYPIGQQVDLYSYLGVFQPAEANGQRWITADGFTLQGDLESLLAAYENPADLSATQSEKIASGEVSQKQAIGWDKFFHIWGTTSQDENGARFLQVDGWEVSPMPDMTLMGFFREINNQVVFISQEGQQWHVSEVPYDVPMDSQVSMRGVQLENQPGNFNWSMIQVEPPEILAPSGGGGGGGGPLDFTPDPNATPEPTPTPLPMPYQEGQQVDGLVGTASVYRLVKSDGSKVTTAYMSAPIPGDAQDFRYYQLLGDNLEELDSLNQLHIKVWGTYVLTDEGEPAIELQHFEKAYPDEMIQAWLGHQQVIELGGRSVLQFIDINGQQYILSRSLNMPEQFLEDPFNGAPGIIEGVLAAETYEGFPMITEFCGQIAVGVTDLNNYTIQSGVVYEETEQPDLISTQTANSINIDTVELVYFAYDLSHGGGGVDLNENPMRFVQPVWKFSGTLSDGQFVEVLVQAVTDEYLH